MDSNKIDGNTIANNVIWRIMERVGAQGVSTIVSIVLARLLDPAMFGVVAIVTIFTNILQVFIDGGFASVLIQKKDADDLDFSTIFWFNIFMCTILYIALFVSSPLIEQFYKMEKLTAVTRVVGLTLVVSGLKSVQTAYISRSMRFKQFFFATLIGTIGAAIIGVALAILGYGVWALVIQGLFNNVVDTIALWFFTKWRPSFSFSWQRFKAMFSFGSKLFLISLFSKVYNELRQLIIGKYYSSSDLAFYNKGRTFPKQISNMIVSSIDSVLFPALAIKQNSISKVKETVRKSIKLCLYTIGPMMVGLAVCGDSFISVLLTDKWLPCVFFMRFACYSYFFDCITQIHINATKAMGKGGYLLTIDVIKKIITLSITLLTIFKSLELLMWSTIVTSLFAFLISAWPSARIIEYSLREQMKDLLPIVSLNVVMGLFVFALNYIGLGSLLTLILQIILGISIYLAGSVIFKFESFYFLLNYLKGKVSFLNTFKRSN